VLLELQVLLVLFERVIWVRVAMRSKGSVDDCVEFLGSFCADSRFECSGLALKFEKAAHGARVDLKDVGSVAGCGLECVLHDAVS